VLSCCDVDVPGTAGSGAESSVPSLHDTQCANANSGRCGAVGLMQQALGAALNSMALNAVVQKGIAIVRETVDCTSGALKGSVCISKLILEVSVPVGLKQFPRSMSFTPTLPLSTRSNTMWHIPTQSGSTSIASVLHCKQDYDTWCKHIGTGSLWALDICMFCSVPMSADGEDDS